jgi:Flp pilus assembly protein TadD
VLQPILRIRSESEFLRGSQRALASQKHKAREARLRASLAFGYDERHVRTWRGGVPFVSTVLTNEIDRVAEISRARRRTRLIKVSVFLLAVVAAAYLWLKLRPLPPLYVAVTLPQLVGSIPEELAGALRISIAADLSQLRGVYALRSSEVDTAGSNPAAIARAVGADEVITATITAESIGCQVEVTRFFTVPSKKVSLARAEVPISLPAVSSVAGQNLLDLYRDRKVLLRKVKVVDFAAYAEIERKLTETGTDFNEILSELAELREQDGPIEAYALEISVARYLYQSTGDATYLEHAHKVIAEAPEEPDVLLAASELALSESDFDRASSLLEQAEELSANHPYLWHYQQMAALAVNDVELSIDIISSSLLARESWYKYLNLADAESRIGLLTSAKDHLEAALQLSPDNPRLMTRLAELELKSGNFEAAKVLFLDLLERGDNRYNHIINLGTIGLLQGDFKKAASYYETALSLGYDDPVVLLNLADTYYLAEDNRAQEMYGRLLDVTSGVEDPVYVAYRAQALACLGRVEDARTTIEYAISIAQDDPSVLYTGAITHVLLGNQERSEALQKRAREKGWDDEWFNLPWFRSEK